MRAGTVFRSALLVMGTLVLGACRGGKFEEQEREIGYRGAARVNPLLAAERLVTQLGLPSASYPGPPNLPPPAGVALVLPAEALRSQGVLDEVSEWVSAGGHLVVFLSMEKRFGTSAYESRENPRLQSFLDYFSLGLEKSEGEQKTSEQSPEGEADTGEDDWSDRMQIDSLSFERDEDYETDFLTPFLLQDLDDPESEPSAFLSFEYGQGKLAVFATANPFINRHLGKKEHASLLWDVLREGESERVWFIHSTRLSFFGLLWQRAPQAVVLLLVTLVLLVWGAAKGFGPRFVRGTNPSAKLDEHLEASGAFFLKHKAEGIVIASLQHKLIRGLARATNQAVNSRPEDLLRVAEERGVLTPAEGAALRDSPDEKTLLTQLHILQNLQNKR